MCGTWKRRQCIFRDTGKSTTTEIIDDHIPKNGFRQFTGIRGEDQKFRFIYNDDGSVKDKYSQAEFIAWCLASKSKRAIV
mgnify:CR=1 FL=1